MKELKKLINKGFALLLFSVFLIPPAALASSEAVLKAIKVDRIDGRNYRITVKTDRDVPVKKYVTAANKVVLDMKNIKPARFVNTMYNNAPEIDHVIVQPVSNDRLRIFIQGMNIASSKILLDTRDKSLDFLQNHAEYQNIKPAKTAPAPQKTIREEVRPEPLIIDLSDKKPFNVVSNKSSAEKVKSVTPVMSFEERSRTNYDNVKERTGPILGKLSDASTFDWTLRFLTLGVIIAAGIKFFSKPKKVEIDLASNDMKTREMELYKSAESKKELLTRSLGIPVQKGSAVKKPNYTTTSHYGLGEYKNSQLPPRKTTAPLSSGALNTVKKPKPIPQSIAGTKTQAKTVKPNQAKVTRKQTAEAKQNFDSVKFLETMASIYQKSGRADLASGIRQNIIQKQQSA